MADNTCNCECHLADAGGLVCSDCAPAHGPRVIEDLKLILREFAREMDEDDEDE